MTAKPFNLSDRTIWLWSHVIDYTICGILGPVFMSIVHENKTYHSLQLAVVMAFQGMFSTSMFLLRERLHIVLLGSRVSKFKVAYRDTPKGKVRVLPQPYQLVDLAKVTTTSMIGFYIMARYGVLWHEPMDLSFDYWKKVFLPFYAILILRDIFFMAPLHTLMHSSPWLYSFHKKHHEVSKSARSLHGYHIDSVDVFLENGGAPLALFAMQYCLGQPIGFAWISAVLLTCHDIGLHSVNPYSVMYFNPLLDCIFYPNVCHQLHHALNKGYLLFTPYQHVFPSKMKKDGQKYNDIFKTDFTF